MEKEIIYRINLPEEQNVMLSKIIKILTINGNFVEGPGLGDGKMGIAILFYNYCRIFLEGDYEIYANNLLDDIYLEINNKTSLDLTSGLTGIGWGIEYLSKNRFVEGNTDEILDEIDKTVYKRLGRQGDASNNNLSEQSGYDFYLNARRHDAKLALADLNSFIRSSGTGADCFNVKFLIDSRNYGLFDGLAGIGLKILQNIQSMS